MSIARQITGLIAFLAITFLATWIGSQYTTPAITTGWYASLPLPPWTPPRWLFGPVWSVLHTLMGIASWLVWRGRGIRRAAVPLALFTVQLALNVGWSAVFFGQRLPGLGFTVIVLLWLAILATLIAFWRVSRWAGILFVPYLLWVTYASTLNFAIWRGTAKRKNDRCPHPIGNASSTAMRRCIWISSSPKTRCGRPSSW